MSKAVDTLKKAASIVGGDRNVEHGSIADGFNKTAKLWSTYLGITITAEQVAIMMTLLKISRTTTGKKSNDHYLDMAGYAAIAGELIEEEEIPFKATVKYDDKTDIVYGTYKINTPSGEKEIRYDWEKKING